MHAEQKAEFPWKASSEAKSRAGKLKSCHLFMWQQFLNWHNWGKVVGKNIHIQSPKCYALLKLTDTPSMSADWAFGVGWQATGHLWYNCHRMVREYMQTAPYGTKHQQHVLGPSGCMAAQKQGQRTCLQTSKEQIFGNFQMSESSNRELLGQNYCLSYILWVKSHVITNP